MHLFLLAMLQRLKTIERSRMLHRTDETDPAASKLANLRESSAGVLVEEEMTRRFRDYSSKGLDPDGGCGEGEEEERERTAQTSCRGKARPGQDTMEGI